MHSSWLHRSGAPACILFFAGWGMDRTPFVSIPNDGYDILMVYDYNQLSTSFLKQVEEYRACHLVAWSMGVWVAGHLVGEQQERFLTRTAIGGTLDPIDEIKGIPPESYNAILRAFSRKRLDDFLCSMFTDREQEQRFFTHRPLRDAGNLAAELAAFKYHYQTHGTAADIYTAKIVTSRDRVFPLKNQLRAWGKKKSTVRKFPHFPFFDLSGWSALLPN